MKIIGFSQTEGLCHMMLKGDSSLLNGRKPMFIPEWTNDLRMTPCIILRVSRLGKNIDSRFAHRYYDAVAPGLDFVAYDTLRQAQEAWQSWTQATCFDFSLAIGEWIAPDETLEWTLDEQPMSANALLLTADEAIHRASRVMTIRQGDLVYVNLRQEPQPVQPEQVVRARVNQTEKLYCKIK